MFSNLLRFNKHVFLKIALHEPTFVSTCETVSVRLRSGKERFEFNAIYSIVISSALRFFREFFKNRLRQKRRFSHPVFHCFYVFSLLYYVAFLTRIHGTVQRTVHVGALYPKRCRPTLGHVIMYFVRHNRTPCTLYVVPVIHRTRH